MTFPRAYLPSGSLDLWATCTSANAPQWPPFTENPPTKKARYDLGSSQAPALSVGESAGQVVLTVFRHAPAPRAASVDYESADQTALAGVDFHKASGTLVFAAGETNQTITIPILSDGIREGSESFVVRLSHPTAGNSLGLKSTASVYIYDNDSGFTLEPALVRAGASATQAVVSVLRQDDSRRPAAVDYATADGTALAGRDYSATTGTLRFAAGEGSRPIVIPLLAGRPKDAPKLFTVRLSGPTKKTSLGTQAVATVEMMAASEVVAWGPNWGGQTSVPSGLSDIVALAAGGSHNLALTAGGQVVAWGDNWRGQTNVPSDLPAAVGIVAGDVQSLVLTDAGEVMPWGRFGGPPYLPAAWSNVVTMASSFSYGGSSFYNRRWCVALTDDGQLVGWEETEDGDYYSNGPSQIPAGLNRVIAVSARGNNILALTEDGRLLSLYLQTGPESEIYEVANGLDNAVAISAGEDRALVLFQQPTIVMPRLEWSNGEFELDLHAQGPAGVSCLLLRSSELRGPWLPTQPVTMTNFSNGRQQVRSVNPTDPAQYFRLRRR